MASPFRLYDTMTRRLEDFRPRESGRVSLYVCGTELWDRSPFGARAAVTFDMVTRYLRHRGWDVTYVRSWMDAGGVLAWRADESGEEPLALADRLIGRLHADADGLGLLPPSQEPRASQYIDDAIALISRLVELGHTYASEGSVWLDVSRVGGFGKLSGQRIRKKGPDDAGDGRRNWSDVRLWRPVASGELAWDSPWGRGRPGWDALCFAMVHTCRREGLDIHGGPIHCLFPHHENVIAQWEGAHPHEPHARYWMHSGLLTAHQTIRGPEPAPTIDSALSLFPAEALRIYYLQAHYRSPLLFSLRALRDALSMLVRLYSAKDVALRMKGDEPVDSVAAELGEDALALRELAGSFEERLHAVMDEDFSTARALGLTFKLARAVNRLSAHPQSKERGGPVAREAIACFDLVASALFLLARQPDELFEEVKDKRLPWLHVSRDDIEARLRARTEARKAGDWAKADALRDELEGEGIQVMDHPDRTVWRIRLDPREEAKHLFGAETPPRT